MLTKRKILIPRFQFGLTLIEIMVALLLGAFLLAGVVQIFISNKQTYRVQQSLSRLQENGRFALDYLNRYIRQTGYVDRSSGISANPACGSILIGLTCMDARAHTFPGSIPSKCAGNTPFIWGGAGSANGPDRIGFRFQNDNRNPGDNMSDCLGANPVRAGTPIFTNELFIGINGSTGEPNLTCRAGANTFGVIDGVENMRILYGERVGNNIHYVPMANVGNINNIQSMRVSLLLRTSDDNLVSQPQPYQFDANNDSTLETITPTDRRLRRVFTTTIALRNSCSD